MQKLVSLALVAFLLSCPQLCRAETHGCCADRCEEAGGRDEGREPAPPPVGNDSISCICAGAIRDSDSIDPDDGPGDRLLDAHPADLDDGAGALPPGPVGRPGAFARPRAGPIRLHLLLKHLRC